MNILLNNYCNYSCKYCFANQVLKENRQDMTVDDFKFVLDFLKKSNERKVRLIGGEPSLHPNFNQFLKIIEEEDFFYEILLLSNGTLKEDSIEALKSLAKKKRVNALINLNHSKVIGDKNYTLTQENISKLNPFTRITLGINIYKPDQDYQYIIDMALKYRINHIRWTVVVPNTDEQRGANAAEYFKSLIPTVVNLLRDAAIVGVECHADCNVIPTCLLDDETLRLLAIINPKIFKNPVCKPVIDIKPDLTVIRCFAMSNKALDLRNFLNKQTLSDAFRFMIDNQHKDKVLFHECKNCASYQLRGRSCTCLAFERKDLNEGLSSR